MAQLDKKTPTTMEELVDSRFAAAGAVAKRLIEKGISTEKGFYDKLSMERSLYQRILNGSEPKLSSRYEPRRGYYWIKPRLVEQSRFLENDRR